MNLQYVFYKENNRECPLTMEQRERCFEGPIWEAINVKRYSQLHCQALLRFGKIRPGTVRKKVEVWAKVLRRYTDIYTQVDDQQRYDIRVINNWINKIRPNIIRDLCSMEQVYWQQMMDVQCKKIHSGELKPLMLGDIKRPFLDPVITEIINDIAHRMTHGGSLTNSKFPGENVGVYEYNFVCRFLMNWLVVTTGMRTGGVLEITVAEYNRR